MSFSAPYQFKVSNREVIVKHSHGGSLRVEPNNLNEANGRGGTGGFARWYIELHGGTHCKLRSKKTGKYLRICRGGKEVDVGGGGGPFTKFKIHYHAYPHGIKLESDRFGGRYIAIGQQKNCYVGSGGRHCNMHVFREGSGYVQPQVIVQPQVQPQVIMQQNNNNQSFNANYLFRQNNTVVIRSRHGKHLRVSPNNTGWCDGSGGQGTYARWNIELLGNNMCRLQSTVTGKRLRITDNGNTVNCLGGSGKLTNFIMHVFSSPNGVKLESNFHRGRYIAIRQNGSVTHGSGGIHTELYFMRKGGNKPQVIYQQVQQPKVIIQQQPPPQVIYQQPPPQQPQVIYQQQPVQSAINNNDETLKLQQQISSMKIQQQQQLEQQKEMMKKQMEQQQNELAQQQQQVLNAQNAILLQQQHQLQQQNSNNTYPPQQVIQQQPIQQQYAQSPQSQSPQNEGQSIASASTSSLPYNPEVINPAQQQQQQQQPQQQNIGYPVLNQQQQSQPIVQQVIQQIEEKQDEVSSPLSGALDLNDAEEVKQWLSSLKMERYCGMFIDNGYDQLEAVAEINKDDLKEMGVKMGHIKIIMNSCINAPFSNKKVLLKSNRWESFLSNYGPPKPTKDGNNKRVEINHKSKRNEGCIWKFEPVDNRTFKLKNVSSQCYLRVFSEVDKDCDGRTNFGTGMQLCLEKVPNEKGQYYIKCEANNIYVSAEKPSTFGKDDVKGVSRGGKNEVWQISAIKGIGQNW